MKRLMLLVLTLLALCGCASQPEPTAAPTEPAVTVPPAVTEAAGLYDADSESEARTGGALKAYPLNRTDCFGFIRMGDDLVLFSGGENTVLTKLSGKNRYVSATTTINCYIFPDDAAIQASEKGMTYYDERHHQLIFLDAQLKEVKKVSLPESIYGAPALSADREKLYYCTGQALRCLDLEDGLDRLLKEMYYEDLNLTGLHCGDTVVACLAEDSVGNYTQLYISAETGQLLYETPADVSVWTSGSFYLATDWDGIYQELLIGDSEQGPTLLTPRVCGSWPYPVPEIGGAVLVSEDAEADSLQLDYYDLQRGKRTAALTLEGLEPIYSVRATDHQNIWYLRYDPKYECEVLYCWALQESAVEDDRVYLSTRYTAENPDLDGIAACQETAAALSEKYGVEVLLWTDATANQPWDYTLVPEYQVPVIREELKELEEFLALYPAGFLKTAAANTGSDRIRICLVRSILGNDSAYGTLREAAGLQYWDDYANTYLCLSAEQGGLMQNACHEVFHIIDSRVITECKAYDDWNALNPKGFDYDYDYTSYPFREDYQWIEGDNRAFIDFYSMSFPKEDRARIMEYAMMPDNAACFESEIMQKKLRQLCLGIREAFGLKKSTEVFIWEQYLNEPLNQK